MNVAGINLFSAFVAYNTKKNIPNTTPQFATIYNNLIMEKTSTAKCCSELKSPCYSKEDVNRLSELEDKYCSLCGSMIKEDGSCPICIVPTFISGNRQFHNQGVSQVNNSHISGVSSSQTIKMGKGHD